MKGLLVFIAGLLAAGAAHADFDELARTRTLEWPQGVLVLEVRGKVEPGSALSPATRFLAERHIDDALPYLCIEALQDVPVDSYDRLGDRLGSSGELYRSLSDLAQPARSRSRPPSPKTSTKWSCPTAFRFSARTVSSSAFVKHERPFPMRRILGFTPTRTFTGLVILAQGEFPSHGKDLRERVQPGPAAPPVGRGHEPRARPRRCAIRRP